MGELMKTIPQILLNAVRNTPEQHALCDTGWSLNYRELLETVLQTAGALQEKGLRAGDRFGIWAPNCAEWVIAALAGQCLGSILVPLNSRYKAIEATDILRRSQCRLLFTVDGFLDINYRAMIVNEHLPDLLEVIILRDFANTTNPFKQFISKTHVSLSLDHLDHVTPEDISDIMFTSGTTGSPKGVMTTHGQNTAVFEIFTDSIDLRTGDRYLIVNPFFHSFGYKAGWLSCLIKGATIYPLALFDAEKTLKQIETHKITIMPAAPTIFQLLLEHPKRQTTDISSLRVATTGAAVIPVDLIRKMKEELKIDHIYSAYGLTETSGVVTLCQEHDSFETIATTCGQAIKNTEIRIVDDNEKDVVQGENGEILVRGFNVMQGYLDDPIATQETITKDGWLKTGDIGKQDAHGYLSITDRKKDMIIVGGFNCYAAEVEQCLMQHPSISEIAIIGVADEKLGEVPHAFIILKKEQPQDEQEIISWTKQRLANFKIPRGITYLDELPRTATGKIKKFLLKSSQMTY